MEGWTRASDEVRQKRETWRRSPASSGAQWRNGLYSLASIHQQTDILLNGGASLQTEQRERENASQEKDKFNRSGQLISRANTKPDRSLENTRRSSPRRGRFQLLLADRFGHINGLCVCERSSQLHFHRDTRSLCTPC